MKPKSEYFKSSESIKEMILEKLKLNPYFFNKLEKRLPSTKHLHKCILKENEVQPIPNNDNNKVNPNEATCIKKNEEIAHTNVSSFYGEIERRFANAGIDKMYKFPRNCKIESDESSFSSIQKCGVYDLNSQNLDFILAKSKNKLNKEGKRVQSSQSTKVRLKRIKIPTLELNSMTLNKKSTQFIKGISQRASPKSNKHQTKIMCYTDRDVNSKDISIPISKPSKSITVNDKNLIKNKIVSKCFSEKKSHILNNIKEKSISRKSTEIKIKPKLKPRYESSLTDRMIVRTFAETDIKINKKKTERPASKPSSAINGIKTGNRKKFIEETKSVNFKKPSASSMTKVSISESKDKVKAAVKALLQKKI